MLRPRQAVAALIDVARNAAIRRAELAWGAANAAEWGHFVALGVFAYDHGGTAAVGVAGVVRVLPAAVIAPFAAPLGDRFRRERFLRVVALLGALSLAASAIAAFAGSRAGVFAAAAAVGVCSTLFRPALQALLPSLALSARDLIAANGATSTIESLGTLAGPLIAGVLVAFASIGAVFAVAAGASLLAALLLARVHVEDHPGSPSDGGHVWDGLRTIASIPRARFLVGITVAKTFVRGCLNTLIVVAAYQLFHEGAAEVGYLTAALGAGGLVGAVGAISLQGQRLALPFGLSLVFWGGPIMLIAPLPYLASAIALLAVVGAANSVEDVAATTLLQRVLPDDVLARVLGVVWGLAMGAVAVGSIAAPALVNLTGPRLAFLPVGGILALLSIVSHRGLAALDKAVAPGPRLALVEGVAIFAPLSLAAKERIAARLVPVEAHKGDLVVRAGDSGGHFFIVEQGDFEVEADEHCTRVGTGGFFGEIALLHDVPRTASVRASSDARLYALTREDFLSAVTGHSGARAQAHAVAAARLATP